MPIPITIDSPRRATIRRDLPASWKEVPQARRLPLWRALVSAPGESGRVFALRLLLDLPRRVWRDFDADHVAALLDALPWMRPEPTPEPVFDSFEHLGQRYFLPDGHGLNLVAIEYPIADEAFCNYVDTRSSEHLRLLCATLCREEEKDQARVDLRGDRRVPLMSRSQAEARARQFELLPEDIMVGVLLYFAGVKAFVAGNYGKVLFEQPDEDEPAEPSTTPSLGWWSIYFNLAVEGPFGNNVEEVYQAPFHDVCTYLVERVRLQKAAEMRARMASKGFGEQD